MNRFEALKNIEAEVTGVDETTLEAIVDGNSGPMTPGLIDAVYEDYPSDIEVTDHTEDGVITANFRSITEARQFLLRAFNSGSQPAKDEHHVFHRLHAEDAMPIEGYLG